MGGLVELVGGPYDGKKMQAKAKDDAIALPTLAGYALYVRVKKGKYEYQYTSNIRKVDEGDK